MSASARKTEDNKALIRRLFEQAIHRGNLAIVNEVFSADFVDHSTPGQPAGPGGVRDYFAAIRRGFPDVQVALEDVLADGDKVVVRTTWRGTHLGSYEGIAPTGRARNENTDTDISYSQWRDCRRVERGRQPAGVCTKGQPLNCPHVRCKFLSRFV